jgi:very-short-patch-repair endonuclease
MATETKFQRLGTFHKKYKSTYAERKLDTLLKEYKDGFFIKKFQREWVFNKMRLDFFFHEVRIGIEIDGHYHDKPEQIKKDKQKESMCKNNDISLLRFSNGEIHRHPEIVLDKIYAEFNRKERR